MSGHLDDEQRTECKKIARELNPFLALPGGSALLPRAGLEYRRSDRAKSRAMKASSLSGEGTTSSSSLTASERLRLKELEADLQPVQQRKLQPYFQTNRKLRRACAKHRPSRFVASLECDAIATTTMIYRAEHDAQRVLAAAWRRYARRKRLAEQLAEEAAAVPIQACARSFIARRLIVAWWSGTQCFAVKWQARMRRAILVRRTKLLIHNEYNAAVETQRSARGFVGRRRAAKRRRNNAATRIQRLYHGAVGRCRADKLWLNQVWIKAQAMIRGALSRTHVANKVRRVRIAAATSISRCYRGFVARTKRSDLLYSRESQALETLLNELTADVLLHGDHIVAVKRRIESRQLKSRVDTARANVNQLVDKVVEAQSNLEQARIDLEQSTPRSVSAGWTEQFKRQIADYRHSVTRAKTGVLFDGLLRLAEVQQAYDDQEDIIQSRNFLAEQANIAREHELKCMWARDTRRRHDREKRERRQRIGCERRRWRVVFCNPEGKPLKQDHASSKDDEKHQENCLNEAISNVQELVKAQNWMNQVAQFDKLFTYFRSLMSKAHYLTRYPSGRCRNRTRNYTESQWAKTCPRSRYAPIMSGKTLRCQKSMCLCRMTLQLSKWDHSFRLIRCPRKILPPWRQPPMQRKRRVVPQILCLHRNHRPVISSY